MIYSTTPVRRVIGFFEVESIDADSPKKLWNRYSASAGIDRNRFFAYFAGCEKGVAIRIGKVFQLARPIPLTRLSGVTTPPQSYRYLNDKVLSFLRKTALAPRLAAALA